MPAQYGFGANNREGFKNRWKKLVELHEEPTVAIGQPRPALRLTPQHDELLSEDRLFRFKSAPRFEWRNKQREHKAEQRNH